MRTVVKAVSRELIGIGHRVHCWNTGSSPDTEGSSRGKARKVPMNRRGVFVVPCVLQSGLFCKFRHLLFQVALLLFVICCCGRCCDRVAATVTAIDSGGPSIMPPPWRGVLGVRRIAKQRSTNRKSHTMERETEQPRTIVRKTSHDGWLMRTDASTRATEEGHPVIGYSIFTGSQKIRTVAGISTTKEK
jgi:hypothetical protein